MAADRLISALACASAWLAATSALPVAAQTAKQRQRQPIEQTVPASPAMAMTMLDPVGSFAPMLERVIPAVVTILVTGETLQPVDLKPRGADGRVPPLAQPVREPFRSGGSGVIVDPERGHILTNNHVIADASRIEVSLSDGRRLPARLIGRDAGTDVAVIEVTEPDLPGLPIGDSDKARVGDVVLAVGNPFGLESTATLGIVSALMRTSVGHEAFEDFMQIDAPINPGNSGGALVNVRGELIGINTAGPGDGGRATGIGFAIPINMARIIKGALIENGRMRRGSPGLIVEDLSPETMAVMGKRPTRGVRIVEVSAGSSAAAAGVQTGGIVTSISGKPVRTAGEFDTRVATVAAGTELAVTINRDGKETVHRLVASEITLEPVPVELPTDLGSIAGAVVGDIRLGNPLFGTLRGAQVLRVPAGTAAYASGLEPGDVIVAIDAAGIRTTEDLLRVANRSPMQYRVKIMRGATPAWVRVSR